MTRYSDYAPTQFDCKGLGLDDRQDWLVLGVMQTRDSSTLARCNFDAALRQLGGESETVEVHRFGHWGPGWYEIILIHPDREADGEGIESSLEDYPILDEDSLSEMEHEQKWKDWESFGMRDWCSELTRAFKLQDETEWRLRYMDAGVMLEWFESLIQSGDTWSDEHGFRYDSALRDLTREDLAAWIRANKVAR